METVLAKIVADKRIQRAIDDIMFQDFIHQVDVGQHRVGVFTSKLQMLNVRSPPQQHIQRIVLFVGGWIEKLEQILGEPRLRYAGKDNDNGMVICCQQLDGKGMAVPVRHPQIGDHDVVAPIVGLCGRRDRQGRGGFAGEGGRILAPLIAERQGLPNDQSVRVF